MFSLYVNQAWVFTFAGSVKLSNRNTAIFFNLLWFHITWPKWHELVYSKHVGNQSTACLGRRPPNLGLSVSTSDAVFMLWVFCCLAPKDRRIKRLSTVGKFRSPQLHIKNCRQPRVAEGGTHWHGIVQLLWIWFIASIMLFVNGRRIPHVDAEGPCPQLVLIGK